MNPFRHLAQLMAVVIVLITAGLLPSVARAHNGVDHGRGAPVAIKAAQIVTKAAPVDKAIVGSLAKARAVIAYQSARTAGHSSQGNCNGACCGTSMACCTPMIAPELVALVSPLGITTLVKALDERAPLGLSPEALPKPPRTFA